MTVVPTAAVVVAASAFAAAMPLEGADPAVGPPAGTTPTATAKFLLCLTTALAAPASTAGTNQVTAPPVAPVPATSSVAMGTEADANTPAQAAALTAPPVPLETEPQPVPDDNVTRSKAPAETTQAVVPLLALET